MEAHAPGASVEATSPGTSGSSLGGELTSRDERLLLLPFDVTAWFCCLRLATAPRSRGRGSRFGQNYRLSAPERAS